MLIFIAIISTLKTLINYGEKKSNKLKMVRKMIVERLNQFINIYPQTFKHLFNIYFTLTALMIIMVSKFYFKNF